MLSQDKIINIAIVIIFTIFALLTFNFYNDLDAKKHQVALLQTELQNKTIQLEDQAKKIADLEAKISEHTKQNEKHAAIKKAQHAKTKPHPKNAVHKKGR